MTLSVISISGPLYTGDVQSVNLKTAAGEITILDHHHPLVSLVEPGQIKIIEQGGASRSWDVNGGFLEVDDNNQLKILVD